MKVEDTTRQPVNFWDALGNLAVRTNHKLPFIYPTHVPTTVVFSKVGIDFPVEALYCLEKAGKMNLDMKLSNITSNVKRYVVFI